MTVSLQAPCQTRADQSEFVTFYNVQTSSFRTDHHNHNIVDRTGLHDRCSPEQFMNVANVIDAAKQWDSDLVEARYIRDLDENLGIIRLKFGESSKPLFRNREFIVYERRETMDDATLVVVVASLPKEIAAGLQPKQNNSIRGLLLQSGWVVEKLEGGSMPILPVVPMTIILFVARRRLGLNYFVNVCLMERSSV
ncbi:uncharacterized protein [Rutidosis leptorrhynchoides]|uniref:uncharacterized protein n=1 Tax=Rutidosis leptorrhynchoides TaxID=125765 RepID=UPI003A98D8DF